MKNRFYPYLIFLFLFLFISCFPWNLFIKNDEYLVISLEIIVEALFLIGVLAYAFLHKNLVKKEKKIGLLFLLPLFLICFSNYVYPLCVINTYEPTFGTYFYLRILLSFIVVINEEIVYRYLGFKYFENNKPIEKIIYTSLIFSISHLSVFLSTFNPMDLIIILYTFGLGLVLGFIYEFHGNIYVVIIFHLLFNMFNDVLFSSLFIVNQYWVIVVISITISILMGIYVLFLYFRFLRISKIH